MTKVTFLSLFMERSRYDCIPRLSFHLSSKGICNDQSDICKSIFNYSSLGIFKKACHMGIIVKIKHEDGCALNVIYNIL
jgi:hypothetical protein